MKEEKRSEIIQDALNFLDDEMIEDVEKLRGCIEKEEFEQSSDAKNQKIVQGKGAKRKKSWRRWTALAASLCVLIAGTWIYENYVKPSDNLSVFESSKGDEGSLKQEEIIEKESEDSPKQEEALTEGHSIAEAPLYDMTSGNRINQESLEALRSGVVIPKMEVDLKKAGEGEVEGDMIGFFIHEGRCYIQYEFQNNYVEEGADFVGAYVGSVTGLLDEWTLEEGYVDGAGTFVGDIYEVRGVDPDFMLCTIGEEGWVETFINNNGITLYKGSDLIDDRLHLRDNFQEISLPIEVDGQIAYEQIPLSSENKEVFQEFLDSFAENEFVYVEEKTNAPFGGDMDTSDMIEFYVTTENGLRLRFRLLGDGYVSFPWIDACVQIDQEIYEEVADVLSVYVK